MNLVSSDSDSILNMSVNIHVEFALGQPSHSAVLLGIGRTQMGYEGPNYRRFSLSFFKLINFKRKNNPSQKKNM
jgi:hypothetical protein